MIGRCARACTVHELCRNAIFHPLHLPGTYFFCNQVIAQSGTVTVSATQASKHPSRSLQELTDCNNPWVVHRPDMNILPFSS